MQEVNNIPKKKKGSDPGDLVITFEDAPVGSKQFVDSSRNSRLFTRGVIAGTPAIADGVVDHPTFGKCYRFNGFTYFNCTNLLQFSTKNYVLELDFVPINTSRNNTVFRSGDYNATGNRSGILLNLNQFPSTYIQAFCTDNISFWRATLAGTNPSISQQVLERIVITRQNGNFTIENLRTGIKSPYSVGIPPYDTYLAFGASDDLSTTYAFDGLLKRAKITIIP